MKSQGSAVPLIDRGDFEELLLEGRFGRWCEQAQDLHRLGYCLLDLSADAITKDCDHLVKVLAQRLAPQLQEWEAGSSGSMRVQDAWRHEPAVSRLALNPQILDLLRHLYGRSPFAFQTLNFPVGSEQPYHSDAVHFHTEPAGFMCGVWIPLADVDPDSGPLVYYPGSHRLPYRNAAGLGLTPEQVAAEPHPQRFFEPGWEQEVDRLGLKPRLFLPRRGQVLIWHANLLHGGSPVVNRQARRWSQVVHFFFEDCLYTTPMKSFSPDQGGATLRTPVDIATGRTITIAMQRAAMDAPGESSLSKPLVRLNSRSAKDSRGWLSRYLPLSRSEESSKMRGHLELVSPSLMTGWVYHPDLLLSDVRLICGARLVASALIDGERQDVSELLSVSGLLGFQMEIPDTHPEPDPDEPLQMLAFTADGSRRLPLLLSGSSAPLTETRLRLALSSRNRGLRGHFDGLSPRGDELIGWCSSAYLPEIFVWLHGEGIASRRIPCRSFREGLEGVSYSANCGFVLPLSEWQEAAGKDVWASYDEAGYLRLPPLKPVSVPLVSERPSVTIADVGSIWHSPFFDD